LLDVCSMFARSCKQGITDVDGRCAEKHDKPGRETRSPKKMQKGANARPC